MKCLVMNLERKVKLYGGIGDKKSNNGTQFYLQNRIYDSNGIAPSLTSIVYWIIIWENDYESKETD